jgi:diacylglycerol O-acyltransferase
MEPAIRLGAADCAWWRMEAPENQMTITAVLTFGDRIEFPRLQELVRTRLLPLPPFRYRLREPPLWIGFPRWVPDAEFDLWNHLHLVHLPQPADDAALQAFVSEQMSQPLDAARPLWHFHYVENYAGGSALVARLHHCIADGIALIHLLLTLDDLPGNETPAALWALHGMQKLPARALRLRTVGAAARAFARLVLLPPDPRRPLRGPLGVRKQAAWSPPFSLNELKTASRRLECTLNDLLTAAAAGALHGYLAAGGRRIRRVRAVVPVNLRRPHELGTLGNRFGLVFLALPVGPMHGTERLARVRREMDRLKASCEAGVTFGLLRLFGPVGRRVVRMAVRFLGWKATAVFTDVPGPRDRVWFCGVPLTGVMAWVPQSGRLSVGISVLSYAGQVQVGIAADAGLVPDPAALVDAYQASLRELTGAECESEGVRECESAGVRACESETGRPAADTRVKVPAIAAPPPGTVPDAAERREVRG